MCCVLEEKDQKIKDHYHFNFFVVVVQVQLSQLPPHYSPQPTHPDLSPSILSPLALSMGPLYMFLDDPSPIFPIIPLPPPLWLLSVCSLFQCFWLYFACLFVLLDYLLFFFFIKVSIHVLCPFLIGLFAFLFLSCMSS